MFFKFNISPIFFLSVLVFVNYSPDCKSKEETIVSVIAYIQTLADSSKKFANIGEFEKAMHCGKEALKLSKIYLPTAKGEMRTALLKSQAMALKNLGITYYNLMDFPHAIEYYKRSGKIADETGDKVGMAAVQLNIGVIYGDLHQNNKALGYYQNSLKVFEEENDKRGIGICFNNIGDVYTKMKQYDKAIEYFKKSFHIREEINDYNLSTSIYNIGGVYEQINDFEKALEYYRKAFKVSQQMENLEEHIASSGGIGRILLKEGKTEEAEKYLIQELREAREINELNYQVEATQQLRNVYEKQGKYKEALAMNDNSIIIRDSITNQQKREDFARQELKSELEKKENEAIAEREKEIVALTRRNNIQLIGSFIVVIALVTGVILLGQFYVPKLLLEGFMFVSFILFYELIGVFADPYIETMTGGAPAIKLVTNAAIAIVLYLLNTQLEKIMRLRLIKKLK